MFKRSTVLLQEKTVRDLELIKSDQKCFEDFYTALRRTKTAFERRG